jgi:glucose/arabinose dehydrogenase
VKSGNRVTLLRDADGDGVYEVRDRVRRPLNAPYGLAFVNGQLYVANQDALVRFDYQPGQTKASGRRSRSPTCRRDQPPLDQVAGRQRRRAKLYVGIGSNSNITERGLDVELERAQVWEIDALTGAHRTYASGIRNPTALASPAPDQALCGRWSTSATRSGRTWCPTT